MLQEEKKKRKTWETLIELPPLNRRNSQRPTIWVYLAPAKNIPNIMCLWLCPRIGTNACVGDLEVPGERAESEGPRAEEQFGQRMRLPSVCPIVLFFLNYYYFGHPRLPSSGFQF